MNLKKLLTTTTLSLFLFSCDDSSSTSNNGSDDVGIYGTWKLSFEDDIDGEIESGYYLYKFNTDNSYTRTLTLTAPDEGIIQSSEGLFTLTDSELSIDCVTEYNGEIGPDVQQRVCTKDIIFEYTLSNTKLTLYNTFEDEGEIISDTMIYIRD